MRKVFILLFGIFFSFDMMAQLEVKEGSFKEVPGFVNINPDPIYQTDDNDLPFAVIKVRTENINDKQRRKLHFEGNAATFIILEYKIGEIWVYLTAKYADYLKISHPDFSSIEFTIPYDLQPKKGYELTLVNRTNYTPVSERPDINYIIIKADQPDALIYIDDIFIAEKECSKSFTLGEKHRWKIECDFFYPESGEAQITQGEPIIIERTMRPTFGYVNVKTEPESDALVFIDGKKIGLSPCQSDRLSPGPHKVKAVKSMFNPVEQTFEVREGQITEATLIMGGNYVEVIVSTDLDADIYVDNDFKGSGTWSGRIPVGIHVFEARKSSYKTSTKTVELSLGKDENITIPSPQPIYGIIDINSSPVGASIYIDDKLYGVTPLLVDSLLIGTHNIRLEKDNCASLFKTISLTENGVLQVFERLEIGGVLDISSSNPKNRIFIDGVYIGNTPTSKNVHYGEHTITAVRGAVSESVKLNDLLALQGVKSVNKTIVVNENNKNISISMSFAPVGSIDAVFTVSKKSKVYFSQGNLQYKASTNTWRFAENQYDIIGEGNENISPTYDGWIDLFEYGTSGFNSKYPPYFTDTIPLYAINFDISNTKYDWGFFNKISNGGNIDKTWRTLTDYEWKYLLFKRNTISSKRYVRAIVNNVKGVIIFPDNWNDGIYRFNNNDGLISPRYDANNISLSDWVNVLEPYGCVFLPAAGNRGQHYDDVILDKIYEEGFYWSGVDVAGYYESYIIEFDYNSLRVSEANQSNGFSVRLVTKAE